jgi:hypothetical protein
MTFTDEVLQRAWKVRIEWETEVRDRLGLDSAAESAEANAAGIAAMRAVLEGHLAENLEPRVAELRAALVDMCHQFAYDGDGPVLHTGGLSALEDAFELVGWTDPQPIPDAACKHEGCNQRGTCGTPTPDGYKWLCGDHYRALSAASDGSPR